MHARRAELRHNRSMLTAILLAATLSPFDQVVAAERGFAAAAIKTGRHQAFLANLSEDAITFNPLPERARPMHENQPPPKGSLQWGPGWVAVSGAADLAVSLGPWRIELGDPSILKKDQVHGWFISMWRRQADGKWKVAVDAGVSSPMTYELPETVTNGSAAAPLGGPGAHDAASAKLAITAAEKAFAEAARNGFGAAIEAAAEPGVRAYREGKPAAIGTRDGHAALAADTRKAGCVTDRIITSSSGDLGYSYGACQGVGSDEGKYGFLHVWRMQADGTFKLLVDVTP